MFEGRILPISEDVMLKWRLLVEAGRKAGWLRRDVEERRKPPQRVVANVCRAKFGSRIHPDGA
jgi:hypothetical protein